MTTMCIQHITVNTYLVIYHVLKASIFSNSIYVWMTGLIFSPGFMNLLTNLLMLPEGGWYKHCNSIIKILTLALSMRGLVTG